MTTTSIDDGGRNQPSSFDKSQRQTSLGISLLQKNDPAGALLLCTSATSLHEENVEGWVCSGDARLMTAAVMRAAASTEEEDEDDGGGWKELVELAMSDYKRATTLDPTNAHARSHLGLSHLLLSSSSSSDALLHLSPISSDPSIEGFAATYNTALAHLTSERQQQRRLALSLLRQLRETGDDSRMEPSSMAIRLNLAGLLLSTGRYNEARQVLTMAKELCDGVWEVRMDKGGDIGEEEDKEVLCAAVYNNWGLAMEMTFSGKGDERGSSDDDEDAISTAYHRSVVWDRHQQEQQEASTALDDDSNDDEDDELINNNNNNQASNTTMQDKADNDETNNDEDEDAAPSSSHFAPTPSPHLELALRALESRAASSSLSEEKSVGLWISLSKARGRAGDVSGAVEAATKAVEMSSQPEQLSTAMSVLDDALQLMTSTTSSIIAEDDDSSGSSSLSSSSSSSTTVEQQSQQQHTVTASSSSDDLNTLRLQLEIQQLKLELLQQTVQTNNDKNNNMKSGRGKNVRRQKKFSALDDYNHIADDDDDDAVYDDYDELYNDRRRQRRRRGQWSRQKKRYQGHDDDDEDDSEDIIERPSKRQRRTDDDNDVHIQYSEETKDASSTTANTDDEDVNLQSSHDTTNNTEPIQPTTNDNDEGASIPLDDVTDGDSSTVIVDTGTISTALNEETIDEANEMTLDDDMTISEPEDLTIVDDSTTITPPNPPTTDDDDEYEPYQEVSHSLPPLFNPPSIERTPLPPVATSLVKMADAYLSQKNYKLAASQFHKVLKKAPTHLPALIGRATCLERTSQSATSPKQRENSRREAAEAYVDATRLAMGQGVESGMVDALFRRAVRMARGLKDETKREFLDELLGMATRYELMFEVLTVVGEMDVDGEERRRVLLMTDGVYKEWKTVRHGRSLVLLGWDIAERYEGNSTMVVDQRQRRVMKGGLIQAKMYLDRALSSREEEVELDEAGRVEALFYKGRVLTMMGDASTAMTIYNETLKLPTTEMTKMVHHHLAVIMDGATDEAKTHFEKSLELGMHVTTEAINALGETHPSIITASSRQQTSSNSGWSSSPYDTQSRKGGILSGGDIVSSQSIFTKQQQQQQTTASGTTADYTLDALEQGGAAYDGEIPVGEEEGDSSLGKVSKQRQL